MKVSIMGNPGSVAGNIGSIVEREATVRWLEREAARQINGADRNLVRALAFGVQRGEQDKMLSDGEREQYDFLDKVVSAVADVGTGKVSQAPAPAIPRAVLEQAKDTAALLERLDEHFAYYQGDNGQDLGKLSREAVIEIIAQARRAVSYGLALARTVEQVQAAAQPEQAQPAQAPDHECG